MHSIHLLLTWHIYTELIFLMTVSTLSCMVCALSVLVPMRMSLWTRTKPFSWSNSCNLPIISVAIFQSASIVNPPECCTKSNPLAWSKGRQITIASSIASIDELNCGWLVKVWHMGSLDKVNWLVPTHWSYSHVSKTMHCVLWSEVENRSMVRIKERRTVTNVSSTLPENKFCYLRFHLHFFRDFILQSFSHLEIDEQDILTPLLHLQ